MNKQVLLMILDGWGIGLDPKISAIAQAKTPVINSLYANYKHSKLQACGLAVGLPEGQMGNSEVGHMNLGAGRVIDQMFVKINKAVESKALDKNNTLLDAIKYAKENNKAFHLMGLVSDGGVHSHTKHLTALCDIAQNEGLTNVFIHVFTDGRDTDPQSGLSYVGELENHLKTSVGKIASVTGRYYAMDRDKRWERVKLAYDAMVNGIGEHFKSAEEGIKSSYDKDITDEFIKPIICIDENNAPIAKVQEGDVVMCFNFRTDRGREITMALTQQDFHEQNMHKMNLHYLTMTRYDESFKGVKILFEEDNTKMSLGEVLSLAGKTQIRIAETEKYPHVTFFFSGGREEVFEGERRLMCPSPKVATYDLQPEMSAEDLKNTIIPEINKKSADFICLNFANPDMVGHTGVFSAVVKACETVDKCAGEVLNAALANDYAAIVIADHGNADFMVNPDGSPNTAHSLNLVPCILVDKAFKGSIKDGKLADIAPTILKLMGIEQPKEMTGDCLIA